MTSEILLAPGQNPEIKASVKVSPAQRSELLPACAHHYSHSRWFWGMRLHLLAAPDGTPRAAILASADQQERDVALRLLERGLHGGELVIADKGYAGKDFEQAAAERFGATVMRPRRKDEPGQGRASHRSANASRASSGP